jgi:hypothetical protein
VESIKTTIIDNLVQIFSEGLSKMGVSIRGLSIPKRKLDSEDQKEIKSLLKLKTRSNYWEMESPNEFKRTLKDKELTLLSGKEKEIASTQMPYGLYNLVRREMSRIFLGKPVNQVWEEVLQLKEDEPYPCPIYHIINFPDNEGYMGPSAIKELAGFFNKSRIDLVKKDKLIEGEMERRAILSFIYVIIETSKLKNGYLNYS